jgi:hypothetical protein
MVIIRATLLSTDRSAVIPNDRPTVLKAEKTSKAILINPLSLSFTEEKI